MVYGDIDEILGDSCNRYFGSGYKKINHSLGRLYKQEDGSFKCNACLNVIGKWSKKKNIVQKEHFSSVDALIISTMAFQKIIKNHIQGYFYLNYFKLKTGKNPILNLNYIPLKVKFDKSTDNSFFLRGKIGNMSFKCKFIELINNYYDEKKYNLDNFYKNISNKISRIKFSDNLNKVMFSSAVYSLENNSYRNVSMLSILVIFAQIGEALSFRYNNVDRDNSNNFWVRRLSIKLNEKHPLFVNKSEDMSLMINKIKNINMKNKTWSCINMIGSNRFLDIKASTALQVN